MGRVGIVHVSRLCSVLAFYIRDSFAQFSEYHQCLSTNMCFVSREIESEMDGIWDRGSLVAINKEDRERYEQSP